MADGEQGGTTNAELLTELLESLVEMPDSQVYSERARRMGLTVDVNAGAGASVSRDDAEAIFALTRAAAVTFELEERRKQASPLDVEGINQQLQEQAATFAAVLAELEGTFRSAGTETSLRLANRIQKVLTDAGVEFQR